MGSVPNLVPNKKGRSETALEFLLVFLDHRRKNQTLSELPTVIVVRAERRTAHREPGPVTSQEVREIIADPVTDSGSVPNKKRAARRPPSTFRYIYWGLEIKASAQLDFPQRW